MNKAEEMAKAFMELAESCSIPTSHAIETLIDIFSDEEIKNMGYGEKLEDYYKNI